MGREPMSASGEDDFAENEHIIDEEWEAGAVRRSPRHGRIIGVSILAGLAVAAVHTTLSTAGADPADPLSSQFSGVMWVFVVLAVVWVAIALLVAVTSVIVLDRVSRRRIRPVITEHRTIISDDLTSPMNDEPPWWVREAEEDDRDRRDPPSTQRPEG